MKIDLYSLKEGENHFQFEEDISLLELPTDLEAGMSVKVNGTASKRGTNFIVKGEVTCRLNLECSRCLESFYFRLEAPIEAYYALGDDVTESNENDEIIQISQADQSINLIDKVREAILLAVPYKTLCYIDCKGLCAVCGSNLNKEQCDCVTRNSDPRWAALKQFQKK